MTAALAAATGLVLFGLWLHYASIGPSTIREITSRLSLEPLVSTSVMLLLHLLLGAEKWRLVEQSLTGRKPPLARAAGAAAVALGAGQFLPAPIASAITRGISNRAAEGNGFRRGFVGSVWEQGFDIYVAIVLCGPALLAVAVSGPASFAPLALAASMMGILPLTLFGWARRQQFPGPFAALAGSRLLGTSLAFRLYGLSLLRFLCLCLITVGVAASVASEVQPLDLAISVPPVMAATALLMIPGGFGATEWSFTALLAAQGNAAAATALFVLANRLILSAAGIFLGCGGALLMAPRAKISREAFAR